VNGKKYHCSTKHNMWTLHKSSECKLETQTKTPSNRNNKDKDKDGGGEVKDDKVSKKQPKQTKHRQQ
jgi:hypothetical protein